MHYKARYWQEISPDVIQCQLCPKNCILKEGQKGFCLVRQNISNELILTTYGLCSGLAIDPIEKKPLYHFYPGSEILSFGTIGCNLGCKFCQNWDLSKNDNLKRASVAASPQDIAAQAKKYNCRSVAFTYNEPSIFAEYAIDTAIECHKIGIKTSAVTSGYIQGLAREDFYKHIDAANVDLKGFSEGFYQKYCAGDLNTVLETLIYIKNHTNAWLEITNLLIPGINDSKDEIEGMLDWIKINLGVSVPLHFTAFHPDYKMLDTKPTDKNILTFARKVATDKGIKYVYTGNLIDAEGSSTYCAKCQYQLIKRTYFKITENNLQYNKCPKCNTILEGFYA